MCAREHKQGGREHKQGTFVLLGLVCAPGSTKKNCFEVPGAQTRDICAPGTTKKQCLCSREHKQEQFVPQIRTICATNKNSLCHKQEQFVLRDHPQAVFLPVGPPRLCIVLLCVWLATLEGIISAVLLHPARQKNKSFDRHFLPPK